MTRPIRRLTAAIGAALTLALVAVLALLPLDRGDDNDTDEYGQ